MSSDVDKLGTDPLVEAVQEDAEEARQERVHAPSEQQRRRPSSLRR